MRCISWNIGRKINLVEDQLKIIEDKKPDIIAFQEVTYNSFGKIKDLIRSKYKFINFSLDLIIDSKVLVGPRKLGVLVATNFKTVLRDINEFKLPWRERILNLDIYTGSKKLNFNSAYIPPGSSNGWIKIETLEGIFNGLNKKTDEPKILCGDFNIPQAETFKGQLITFAQKIKQKGKPKLKKSFRGGSGSRWDLAERNLFENLKTLGIQDAFRKVNGFKKEDYSFEIIRKGKVVSRRRFDHFFTSDDIKITKIEYLHSYRLEKLSDHSPIMIDFEL